MVTTRTRNYPPLTQQTEQHTPPSSPLPQETTPLSNASEHPYNRQPQKHSTSSFLTEIIREGANKGSNLAMAAGVGLGGYFTSSAYNNFWKAAKQAPKCAIHTEIVNKLFKGKSPKSGWSNPLKYIQESLGSTNEVFAKATKTNSDAVKFEQQVLHGIKSLVENSDDQSSFLQRITTFGANVIKAPFAIPAKTLENAVQLEAEGECSDLLGDYSIFTRDVKLLALVVTASTVTYVTCKALNWALQKKESPSQEN